MGYLIILKGNLYSYLIKSYEKETNHVDVYRTFVCIGYDENYQLISARSDDYGLTWQNVNVEEYDFSYIEFNRSRYFPSTNSFLDLPLFHQSIVDSSDMRKSFPLLVESGRTPNSACTKLIKRDFLISNNGLLKIPKQYGK